MTKLTGAFLLASGFLPGILRAQIVVHGKIFEKGLTDLLPSVTVRNISRNTQNLSDLGGNYRIAAHPGDTIVITATGFLTDTVRVTPAMDALESDIDLGRQAQQLAVVEVDELAAYERDSIQRHEDYAELLNKKHPVKFWNEKRPMDNTGLNFSPLGYYSKTEKRKRRLKQRIRDEDRAAYIDARFSRSKVSHLTSLRGDSLQTFMQRFTPTYESLRNMTRQDVLLYINDKLVLFRRGASP